jgi:NAD(P)-dependent dehydrogenase (short-subunit alcohol dehydrogenase family)
MQPSPTRKTVLLIGASRGLGFAMVEEYLKRDWDVIATARADSGKLLQQIASVHKGSLEVETLEVTDIDQIVNLRRSLHLRTLDLLFINAGVNSYDDEKIGDVSTEEFVRVMVTNSLSPMRVVEAFQDMVPPTGSIGVMSSELGSLTNNTNGNHEVYRGSKAALNMFMRSFAARHSTDTRTLLLLVPGWVRTDMGGPDALLSIGESIPSLVNTIQSLEGKGGLHYVDYLGRAVPW